MFMINTFLSLPLSSVGLSSHSFSISILFCSQLEPAHSSTMFHIAEWLTTIQMLSVANDLFLFLFNRIFSFIWVLLAFLLKRLWCVHCCFMSDLFVSFVWATYLTAENMCIIFHFCISLDFKFYVCSYFIFIFSHFLIVLITLIGYFVCVCVSGKAVTKTWTRVSLCIWKWFLCMQATHGISNQVFSTVSESLKTDRTKHAKVSNSFANFDRILVSCMLVQIFASDTPIYI